MSSAASTHLASFTSNKGKPLNPHMSGSSNLSQNHTTLTKLRNIIYAQVTKKRGGGIRGHVIADSEEGDPKRSGSDKANEGIGVVDGGGVEKSGNGLGERTHRHEHQLSRNPSHVVRPPCPFHFSSHSQTIPPLTQPLGPLCSLQATVVSRGWWLSFISHDPLFFLLLIDICSDWACIM
jgi:hypothetical protein